MGGGQHFKYEQEQLVGRVRDKNYYVLVCKDVGRNGVFGVYKETCTIKHFIVQIMHTNYKILRLLTFRRRIKSRLPFAGIIRRLLYYIRFQDKG